MCRRRSCRRLHKHRHPHPRPKWRRRRKHLLKGVPPRSHGPLPRVVVDHARQRRRRRFDGPGRLDCGGWTTALGLQRIDRNGKGAVARQRDGIIGTGGSMVKRTQVKGAAK
jgi:hypothetical protein